MKLSIIIPVFNEEKTILTVLKKLSQLKIPGVESEIIIVDDGSMDNSYNLIIGYSNKQQGVYVIRHVQNQGKGAAVISGIRHARGEYILIQDADLEYNPEYIPIIINALVGGEKIVVYGTRLNRLPNFGRDEKNPLFLIHYLGNRALSFLTSVLYGQWITDMETGYKLFPKKATEGMNLHAKSFDFEPEITTKLLKAGYKIIEVPISTKPRGYKEGKKLNALKDGAIALWTILKYRFVK